MHIDLEDVDGLIDRIAIAISHVDRVDRSQLSDHERAGYTLRALAAFSTIAWAPEWKKSSPRTVAPTGKGADDAENR